VIDSDLGQSGASATDREGFQYLVAEVSLGRAGVVLGLEVSRLARNSTDWHRLLELCALSDTLILDEDGLYSPNDFNDRLLLGLKGTMSEAELHILRARLRGGILSKARRGAFTPLLPTGFVYDEQRCVQLDPDTQVRQTFSLFFRIYRRTGSASGIVNHFRKEGIRFPVRILSGPRKGELVWGDLGHGRALQVLHNPRYAGIYFYGRSRRRRRGDGRTLYEKPPRKEWHAWIPDAHEGYISLEEYEENQRRLRAYAQAHGRERRAGPPREGCALLQGMVLCGICGHRMTVRYHVRQGRTCPDYVCQWKRIENAGPICQRIPGTAIDKAIATLLLKTLTPVTLDVALAVQEELSSRLQEADRLREQQVERARYEAELARQRYMQVEPGNRFVADTLEADWNEKLRILAEVKEDCERQRAEDVIRIDGEERTRIMKLATDFPRLWKDPNTSDRDRKRMVRLLLEDVTLIKDKQITVHVHFKGGATTTLTLALPLRAWEIRQTSPEVVAEIDRLLDKTTEPQIAKLLNGKGLRSGEGQSFHTSLVARIRREYNLKSRYHRLREAGMLTKEEMAKQLGVHPITINIWRKHGLLLGHPYNGRNECLYEPPGPEAPVKCQGSTKGGKLLERRRFPAFISDCTNEV
jgi:DNA invertase Pin-like site-specific DNA recombinase